MPWANGLGTSREILLEERASPDRPPELLWRLATTRIESDCPFSEYPGQDRTIVMLRGKGFELAHAPGKTQTVTTPFVPVNFGGDQGTRCRLLEGPVEVLNLMFSRAHASCSLTPMRLLAATAVEPIPGGTRALYVLEGSLAAGCAGGSGLTLQEGDALRLDPDPAPALTLHAGASPVHLLLLEARIL